MNDSFPSLLSFGEYLWFSTEQKQCGHYDSVGSGQGKRVHLCSVKDSESCCACLHASTCSSICILWEFRAWTRDYMVALRQPLKTICLVMNRDANLPCWSWCNVLIKSGLDDDKNMCFHCVVTTVAAAPLRFNIVPRDLLIPILPGLSNLTATALTRRRCWLVTVCIMCGSPVLTWLVQNCAYETDI